MTINQKLIVIGMFLLSGLGVLMFASTHPCVGPNPLNLAGGVLISASVAFTFIFFGPSIND